jgi:hypothetical protein
LLQSSGPQVLASEAPIGLMKASPLPCQGSDGLGLHWGWESAFVTFPAGTDIAGLEPHFENHCCVVFYYGSIFTRLSFSLFSSFLFFFSFSRFLLCSLGWPWTCDSPTSAYQLLGL